MGFGQAIASFFKNYVTFTGRARRSEYWFAYLFVFLVTLAVCWIPVLGWIWDVAVLLPNLSIMVRRLHDIGKHWYWIFMYCIPFAGLVFFFIYTCSDSQGDNEWGVSPKYPGMPKYFQAQAAQQYGQQYAQPQYGQQYAQPQYGQQQYAQPQYAQQQYAQPQYAQQQYAQQQYAQQQYARQQYAQQQYAQAQNAQQKAAQPQYYQPQAAQAAKPVNSAGSSANSKS